MKILYAIQGTGNGHLSRAREMVPALRQYADVDLLVSGTQSEIKLPWPLAFQYKGFSFCYNRKGAVSKIRSLRENLTPKLIREIRSLPVKQYDLVINDFEPVSAWAASRAGVPCVAMSHQSAYLSDKSPRPARKDWFGEAVLRHYAPVQAAVGFHFHAYDDFIYTPVIRSEVRELAPRQDGFFVVYLPAYRDEYLVKYLAQVPGADWLVFSRYSQAPSQPHPRIRIEPVQNEAFIQALAHGQGVLTGGGFETPAEAMFLGKKVFAIPVHGQYEQQCNAAALVKMGHPVVPKLDAGSLEELTSWVNAPQPAPVIYPHHTVEVVEKALEKGMSLRKQQETQPEFA